MADVYTKTEVDGVMARHMSEYHAQTRVPGQDSVEKIANELSEVGNRMSGHPYRPDLVDLIERLRALKPEQHKIVMCMRKLQLHNGRNVEAWRAIVDGYEREAECDDKYRVLSDALRGYGIEVEEQ
jgi:hypothetical protein